MDALLPAINPNLGNMVKHCHNRCSRVFGDNGINEGVKMFQKGMFNGE